MKGKVSARDPQGQVLSTVEIYLPQRDRGQGMRDKDRRQRTRETGQACLSQRTKFCLWIEGHRGKWWFIKVEGKPYVRMRCLLGEPKENLVAGLQ